MYVNVLLVFNSILFANEFIIVTDSYFIYFNDCNFCTFPQIINLDKLFGQCLLFWYDSKYVNDFGNFING